MTRTEVAASAICKQRPIGLRAWFVAYLLWMGALTLVIRYGVNASDADSSLPLAAGLLAAYAAYLSLCCAFFPAPTTYVVMLAASNALAEHIGVADYRVSRVLVVATVGAFATDMANLNEYHLLTWLLRFRALGKVRDTRLYKAAIEWFETNPFMVLIAVSLIPIPIDVIRWLAITDRYPRSKYFLAYFIGRWVRYAGLSVTAIGLSLKPWHIFAIQGVLVLVAMVKIIPGFIRHAREHAANRAAQPAGETRRISGEPAAIGGSGEG